MFTGLDNGPILTQAAADDRRWLMACGAHDGAEQAREALARACRSRKQPLPAWAVARPGS